MLSFGVIGYFMLRYGYSTAGAAIAIVLGNGFESYLRRGLLLCDGSLISFVTRPVTALILAISFALLFYGAYGTIKLARQSAKLRRESLAYHGNGNNSVSDKK